MSGTTTPSTTPATPPAGPEDLSSTETFVEGITSIRMKLIDKVLAYNGLTMAGVDRSLGGAAGIVAVAAILEAYVMSPDPAATPEPPAPPTP